MQSCNFTSVAFITESAPWGRSVLLSLSFHLRKFCYPSQLWQWPSKLTCRFRHLVHRYLNQNVEGTCKNLAVDAGNWSGVLSIVINSFFHHQPVPFQRLISIIFPLFLRAWELRNDSSDISVYCCKGYGENFYMKHVRPRIYHHKCQPGFKGFRKHTVFHAVWYSSIDILSL